MHARAAPYNVGVHSAPDEPDLASLYEGTRQRITSLVSTLDDTALNTTCPTCPAWSVRDVVSHLTAIAEDSVAGRLAGPPTEADTATQVARFADRAITDILAVWGDNAPRFEYVVGTRRIWTALIDVVSHEHDIRTALHLPGARDTDAVWHCAESLLTALRPPVAIHIVVEDAEFTVGPEGTVELELVTSRFEALRWRMGRRSRAQVAALDWSGDPTPLIDHLMVFGPAAHDVDE